MIPILFLAGAAASPAQSCAALVRTDAEKAVAYATGWIGKGGAVDARQCLGMAYAASGRWAPAATAFEQGATDAQAAHDGRAAALWMQSGNAWLAAGDAARARSALDSALASPRLSAAAKGEARIDRARAGVALGDLTGARADIDQALTLEPAQPLAWYLSAALARRERNYERAKKDIASALRLAPADADLLLEAGTIAGASGDTAGAVGFYQQAAKASPDSPAGRAARAALEANTATAK